MSEEQKVNNYDYNMGNVAVTAYVEESNPIMSDLIEESKNNIFEEVKNQEMIIPTSLKCNICGGRYRIYIYYRLLQ